MKNIRKHFLFVLFIVIFSLGFSQDLRLLVPDFGDINISSNYNVIKGEKGNYKVILKKMTYTPNGVSKPTIIKKLKKGYAGKLIPFNGSLVQLYCPEAKVFNGKTHDELRLWLTQRDFELNEIKSFEFQEIKQKIGSFKIVAGGLGGVNTRIPFTNDLIKSDNQEFLLSFAEKKNHYNRFEGDFLTNKIRKDQYPASEIIFYTFFDKSLNKLSSGSYDFGIKKGYIEHRFHHFNNKGEFLVGIKFDQQKEGESDGWKFLKLDKYANEKEAFIRLKGYNMTNSRISYEDDKVHIVGIVSKIGDYKYPKGVFKLIFNPASMEVEEQSVYEFTEHFKRELSEDSDYDFLYFECSSTIGANGYNYFTIRKATKTTGGSNVLGKQNLVILNPEGKLEYQIFGNVVNVNASSIIGFNHDSKTFLMYSFCEESSRHIEIMDDAKNWEKGVEKLSQSLKIAEIFYLEIQDGKVLRKGFVRDEKGQKVSRALLVDNHPYYEGLFIGINARLQLRRLD